MPGPTLSRMERERIAEAAKLATGGARVKWRAVFPHIWYEAHGKHPVTSAGSWRVFWDLWAQVETEWRKYGNDTSNSAA